MPVEFSAMRTFASHDFEASTLRHFGGGGVVEYATSRLWYARCVVLPAESQVLQMWDSNRYGESSVRSRAVQWWR